MSPATFDATKSHDPLESPSTNHAVFSNFELVTHKSFYIESLYIKSNAGFGKLMQVDYFKSSEVTIFDGFPKKLVVSKDQCRSERTFSPIRR